MPDAKDASLFEHAHKQRLEREQPLAARLRPRTLDEFVGQDPILAPGRLLRRAIQADRISSLIFYGPPGTGKTTLASVIANTTRSAFEVLNAVLAGVRDVRRVTDEAHRRHAEHGRRTILFVDEVHRWNKAQQDALLPWVENGTIILIGATTENPYFTVNRALVSRSRIFQLKPLDKDQLKTVARNALANADRGYGELSVVLHDDALEHIANVANGDARAVLNALELAVETTEPTADGTIEIDMDVAEESIQRRAVLYDKEGDYHFDTISAFIKSLRGSDPDAALYWLAKMVYAGEDPRFLFRRMLIFCGEDVGLADPNAMSVVEAAAAAFDRVGLPEGRYHLGFATLYLATAPKSNSVMGLFDALAAVASEKDDEVPNHLRDASRDKEGFGHGKGYLYPHSYRDHWVAQQYLPGHLQGRVFYQPGEMGYESEIAGRVQRRREEQLAAVFDRDADGAPPEILSTSPEDRATDQWLERTVGDSARHLADLREAVFDAAGFQRQDRVLVLRADPGLLVWEAVRRVPEGGVWAQVGDADSADRLRHQGRAVAALRTPHWLEGPPEEVARLLVDGGYAEVRFEHVLARNLLLRTPQPAGLLADLAKWLASGGCLVLCEVLPARTQRLHDLLDPDAVSDRLLGRLRQAENALYDHATGGADGWDGTELEQWLEGAGFRDVRIRTVQQERRQTISPVLLDRWFADSAERAERRTYRAILAEHLSPEEVDEIEALFRKSLTNRTVAWHSTHAICRARSS